MKTKFKNFETQINYISKFVTRYTSLKRECQICGNPANIKHNMNEPYKVQFLCTECKKNLHFDLDSMYKGIPLIDIRDYIISPIIKNTHVRLTEDNINLMKKILNSENSTKSTICTRFNITEVFFENLVSAYEEHIDKDIRNKLNDVFYRNKKKIMRNAKQTNEINNNIYNNISKIKAERGLSNRDIEKLSNGKLTPSYISIICNSKHDIKIKTKCTIAEVFNLSVADVFPDDYLYNQIYNYQDFIDFNNKYRQTLSNIISQRRNKCYNNIISKISSELGINCNQIYLFIGNHQCFNHDKFVKLNEFFKKEGIELL